MKRLQSPLRLNYSQRRREFNWNIHTMRSSLIYLCVVPMVCSFEFNDLRKVKKTVSTMSAGWKTQCTLIIRLATYSPTEMLFLDKLQMELAKQIDQHSSQVLSITFDDYFNRSNRSIKTCGKSLNIVMVGKGTKAEVEKNSAWLFFMNSSEPEEFFADVNLNVASEILSVSHQHKGKYLKDILLIGVYKVAAKFPVKLMPLLESEYTSFIGSALQKEQRGNLAQINFGAISVEYWPMTTFAGGEFDGFLAKVWNQLEDVMNFTTNLTSVNDVKVNETHDELEHRIIPKGLQKDVDFIVAELTLTPDRLESIDYLLPHVKSSMQVYFPLHGYQIDWKVVLRPFTDQVWMALALWVVISCLALYLISTITRIYRMNSMETSIFSSPLKSFFFVLQTICLQGSYRIPRCNSVRIAFVTCYIFATVLLPYYSASLISSLTKKQPLKPFDDLAKLANSRHKVLVLGSTSDEEYFTKSDNPLLLNIYKNQVVLKDFASVHGYQGLLEDLCTSNVPSVAIAVESSMDSVITNGNFCHLVKFSKPISPVFKAMAIRKRSQYRELFNYNLLRFWETGTLNRYFRVYVRSDENKYTSSESSLFNVSLIDVSETFCILLVGIILSMIILFAEMLLSRQKFQSPLFQDNQMDLDTELLS